MSNDIVIQLLMSIKDCPVAEQQKVILAIVNGYNNGGQINYRELSVLSQSVVFAAVKHLRETNAPICETMAQNLACAGTISPKSKICGKLLSPSVPQGEIDADVDAAAETEEDTDAVDEILNNPDNHSIWFDTTCCNLVWGDLLKDNLPWVLTYFRGHLYRNGEEQELHDIRDFKRHFFNFCRNPISANEMLKALHYHLDSLSREQGIVSSEATFRTMMQNDFPNLYQMMIPMTMEQCNDLIRKYGPQRVKQAMQSANMSKRALYTADAYSLVVEKLKVKS